MSHGSKVGRSVFVLAAATGVAGLLTYTPPPTDVQAAGSPDSPAQESRPAVTGPFTATPSSVPPIPVATTSTTPAPVVSTPVTAAAAPPVTEPAPPPPPPPEAEAPAATAYAPSAYVPPPRYTDPYPEPEPDPEFDPPDESDGPCAGYDDLLRVLDDKELRAAISTVGCA